MKKRIAVIGLKGLPAFGGAATVGENIIDQLKDKYDFTVYLISSHTQLKSGQNNGYNVVVFSKLPFIKLNTLYYYILSAFHSIICGKYAIIHLHHRDAAFLLLILRLRFKTVITTHGLVLTDKWRRFKFFFEFQNRFIKYSNIITCVSLKDQNILKNYVKRETIYIPNGVNIEIIEDKPKTHLMFASGRILQTKGCHVFIEAAKIICCKEKIVIAGKLDAESNYSKNLLAYSKDLKIEFIGLIKEKNKLKELIQSASLFIYPSIIESMSMMLLEVAALKTPIICCDIPENRDVFSDNEVLFCKVNDHLDLAEKLQWAIMHPNEMREFAENAYQKLNQYYTWKKIAGEYIKVYEKLLIE